MGLKHCAFMEGRMHWAAPPILSITKQAYPTNNGKRFPTMEELVGK